MDAIKTEKFDLLSADSNVNAKENDIAEFE